MKALYTLFFATTLSLFSCEKNDTPSNNPITYGETYLKIDISTDKAVYTPGSTVRFSLASMPSGTYKVRYSYLGEVIKEEPLTSASWQWVTPADDYRGIWWKYTKKLAVNKILTAVLLWISLPIGQNSLATASCPLMAKTNLSRRISTL